MRAGLPRYDADGVIDRINAVAEATRNANGRVIYVQHDRRPGSPLEPNDPGWELLPAPHRGPSDPMIRKKASDSFYDSKLGEVIEGFGSNRLIIAGCATDFCVDTTFRSAASGGYEVIALRDGHTTRDRPPLDSESIIRHYNWMWKNLILPEGRVKVVSTERLIREL